MAFSEDKLNRGNQRVLVLGATGSIGSAIANVLTARGHLVTCLARSDHSEAELRSKKFDVIRGDIRTPQHWIENVSNFDAVIHAAITWADDMAETDRSLVSNLIRELKSHTELKTLIYTGGCWLYGNTGDNVATEETTYDPLPEFAFAMEVGKQVCEHEGIRGITIHPAMVYERDGGVLESMITDAIKKQRIRIVGSKKTRWTMVHRMDLAELYALALERGRQGENYNGASIEGIEVGKIANTLAKRFNVSSAINSLTIDQAKSELGFWAEGYSIDQQMSGKKAMSQLDWNPKHNDVIADIE